MKTFILAALLAATAASGVVVTAQPAEAFPVKAYAPKPGPKPPSTAGDQRVNMGGRIGWVYR